ncbi:MAG: carbamoyl-phosphate synthase large subunit, partial [Calditrichaeota bacterium]|nr:carbamoyl-phosphate synthase large subunit [Calditrichota bacterium]
MPKRTDIHKILIIGSGPIQIGQGCEFDYSGTQACKALKDEGYEVILINSNPATIMTDPESADQVYIEPISYEFVIKVIEKEKPDAILPTMGGQAALNILDQLHQKGDLKKYNLKSIGVSPETIEIAEDREKFKALVDRLGYKTPKGDFVRSKSEALQMLDKLNVSFPVIIRAAYTLGGTGGGIAYDREEYVRLVEKGLDASPIHELQIEESILGWKEYELEVMQDPNKNFVVVCSVENVNPVGVHTGDSITIAPSMTLTDKEYQKLRDIAKDIFAEIGMESGGANIQFAVHPDTGEIIVIEMNPRVSRSSALVSKATGYPIARISAKIAAGYNLDELTNEITGHTPAAFEPVIDYIAIKIPRWDFAKFPESNDGLGIQMKSVGEVLAFGRGFKDAFQKAWRSLENGSIGWTGLDTQGKNIREILKQPTAELFNWIKTALEEKISIDEIYSLTKISKWFLKQLEEIVSFEQQLIKDELTAENLREAKKMGLSNKQLAVLLNRSETDIEKLLTDWQIHPTFKMVDTCSAEFEAKTPYYFKTYEQHNDNRISDREKIIIIGSGPNRIGQGIEFDYSCVHAVKAFQEAGYEAILVNCNPETVSTDYNTSDKLYVEPLTREDVLAILNQEKPKGVVIQFGGQTPLKLAKDIEEAGFKILGTDFSSIELAENREEFGRL